MVALDAGGLPPPDPPFTLLSAPPSDAAPYLATIPISLLVPTADRVTDTPAADRELADNIRAVGGILSPLEVAAKDLETGLYPLMGGHRRRKAMLLLGMTEAPCRVHPGVVTRQQIDAFCHALDVQEKRPPLDQGLRFLAHIDATGHTQAQCAKHFGCSEAHVSRCLRAADSSPETRGSIAAKLITAAHISAVGKVKDLAKREALLRRAEAEGLTSKQLRKLASGREKRPAARTTTVSHGRFTVTFPSELKPEEVDAGLAGLRSHVRQVVKAVDVKALPMSDIVGRATTVKVAMTVGAEGGSS